MGISTAGFILQKLRPHLREDGEGGFKARMQFVRTVLKHDLYEDLRIGMLLDLGMDGDEFEVALNMGDSEQIITALTAIADRDKLLSEALESFCNASLAQLERQHAQADKRQLGFIFV